MKKMLTINNNCTVLETMNKKSNVIWKLNKGEYVEYKRIKRKNKNIWFQIVFNKSKVGFIEAKHGYIWEKGIVISKDSYLIPEGGNYANKVRLNKYSIIQFVNSHTSNSNSYKIQTKSGEVGIVSGNSKIIELDWFYFKLLHLIIFFGTIIISMFVMISTGMKRTGGIISLALATGIALGMTIIVMILTFLIKFVLFEIRVRI